MLRSASLLILATWCVATTADMARAQLPQAPVDFNRDIRPILSDRCFHCHGPDGAARQADLRLDTAAVFKSDEHPVVVTGRPDQSLLLQRIASTDPDVRMPPVDAGSPLTAEQIDLIRRWIEQGARWSQHWAFRTPVASEVPAVRREEWPRSPIDHFVLAQLDERGLKPSTRADRNTLLRRVTLDLTGLPPTPAEVQRFVNDTAPDAWERVVDRLLASPRYGERMAIRWLEAARYADTSGYQTDGPRDMWRWRDWVIDAYNANMPFDQFTVEQLAGDLLPKPTLDQRIATAFNRNHRGNAEGGIIPAEYQVEYVVDRVDTTATVWLGLTLGCARCHDHKYDPISQREFYQVFAGFNNIPENGRALKEGNSPPWIAAPTFEQQRRLRSLEEAVRRAERQAAAVRGPVQTAQRRWETRGKPPAATDWTITRGLIARCRFDGDVSNDVTSDVSPRAVGGAAEFVDGPVGSGFLCNGERFVDAGDLAGFGYFDAFTLSAWVKARGDGTLISRMTPVARGDGYSVEVTDGRLHVNLVKRWHDDSIRVGTRSPLNQNEWHHVAVVYDGSRRAAGITIFVDGGPQPLEVRHDFLNQTFANTEPLRIGGGARTFDGSLDDVRVYQRALSPAEVRIVATSTPLDEIFRQQQRSAGQRSALQEYFLRHHAAPALRQAVMGLRELQRERDEFRRNLPTVMVMEDSQPRQTFVLRRGQYNLSGEPVEFGVPSVLPPLPAGAARNRLGLARWLTEPDHPLTSRVAVNRYWQMHFGHGLVTTTEDFGSQGASPSHPQLLDWLATEFVRSAWNVKTIHRRIVTSATYQQVSTIRDELLERDPDNRWYARGPRVRLPAEMIRDQALAAAGLLHEAIGGPSVNPYQPDGLWSEIASDGDYRQSQGADLYRRSLYTYWKRTVTPPVMTTFDAPARETCTVRQPRTNTPLQALALLNDVTWVEAARRLAEHVAASGGPPEQQVVRAFQRTLGRKPRPAERQILVSAYQRYLDRFQQRPGAAAALIAVGESRPDQKIGAPQLAALTAVASLILNLDETITRN